MSCHTQLETYLTSARVVPVLTIESASSAKALAETLVKAGLTVLEVTLRTDQALEAISEMSSVPGAIVGAGTLRLPIDVERARAAGAVFGLSPGGPAELLQEAKSANFPFVPGVGTATESMVASGYGYKIQKFFPAEAAGGVEALRSMVAPLAETRFCPTGGVSEENLKSTCPFLT